MTLSIGTMDEYLFGIPKQGSYKKLNLKFKNIQEHFWGGNKFVQEHLFGSATYRQEHLALSSSCYVLMFLVGRRGFATHCGYFKIW